MSKISWGGVQTHSTFRKVIALILTAVVVLSLAGCPSPTDDTPPELPAPIGKKAAGDALEVGDIVFNDGTATPYSEIASRNPPVCTDEEKAVAVAVIFKVSDGKTLGVGVKYAQAAWAVTGAKGYETNFSGNTTSPDGSKAIQKMALELGDDNDTGITVTDETTYTYTGTVSNKYPAFKFAYSYGTTAGHNINSATVYKDGWYLPSSSELYAICYKTNVFNALLAAGGNDFNGKAFWTADQGSSPEKGGSYTISKGSCGNFGYQKDTATVNVCAIRVFN